MIVSDFTKPELNYFRENCNFVNDEIKVFEMRSQGIGLEEIAERLHLTHEGIKRISRKVNRKITVVLNYKGG
jgi:transcriptional regulator